MNKLILLLILVFFTGTSFAATLSWDEAARAEGVVLSSERKPDVYNITLKESGFDPIVIKGTFSLTKNSMLNISTLAYDVTTYGSRVDLFAWDKKAKGSWGDVTINGLSLGPVGIDYPSFSAFDNGTWRGSFVVASDSIYLDNLSVVPEASTLFLLCAAFGLLVAYHFYKKLM